MFHQNCFCAGIMIVSYAHLHVTRARKFLELDLNRFNVLFFQRS